MDISRRARFYPHHTQTKRGAKHFQQRPTNMLFELVKWICFADTEINKTKLSKFTGKQFQYIIKLRE